MNIYLNLCSDSFDCMINQGHPLIIKITVQTTIAENYTEVVI